MSHPKLMAVCAAIFMAASASTALGQTEAAPTKAPSPAPALNHQSFAQQISPRAPDYALASSWAARPGAEGFAAHVAPGSSSIATSPDVDVFYVYPTTYRSLTVWNQDIADQTTNAWTNVSVIARQAGIFNGCCRVFAPWYRQGSSLSFTDRTLEHDGGRAFDLAYADVLRAFDYYIEHDNHGRPFILAGHSQGALHVTRLLEDRIDNSPLAARMVAAYAVGTSLSVGDFGKTYKTLQICAEPAQTGCVVAWNSILQTDVAAAAAGASGRYVIRHGDDAGRTPVCVNPLTFDLGEPVADRSRSRGAAPGDPGAGDLRALAPRSVAARCELGMLVVTADPALELKPLAGYVMHYHDYGMFYADVRANAITRSKAWLTARPAKSAP